MSEGLEALEELKQDLTPMHFSRIEKLDRYNVIEKELKALEIIKEKKVNVDYLDECIRTEVYPLSTYNDMVEDNRKLSQEEYDLLKKVLL